MLESVSTLPEWAQDALREPVPSDVAARARIMDAITALPATIHRRRTHHGRLSPPPRPSRWTRRGLLAPVGGFVSTVLVGVGLMLQLGITRGGIGNFTGVAQVLGDSVVPARHAMQASGPARFLDTLRIVEFVIRGSTVQAASVLGDFNHWRRGATPMVASGSHEWRARVLVSRDALHVAFLVNNAHLMPASVPGGTPLW